MDLRLFMFPGGSSRSVFRAAGAVDYGLHEKPAGGIVDESSKGDPVSGGVVQGDELGRTAPAVGFVNCRCGARARDAAEKFKTSPGLTSLRENSAPHALHPWLAQADVLVRGRQLRIEIGVRNSAQG